MTRYRHLLLLSVAAALLSLPSAVAANLDEYRWQHRLLLLFAPDEKKPAYVSAAEDIARRSAEVADRDLVVFHVLEDGPSRVNGRMLSQEEVRQLRHRFEIPADRFAAVLIGKDGGVKLVRYQAVELQEVFDRIDAMPMRQREMRQKKSSP